MVFSRGQSWGVMEVLISVIILAMSMSVVFYVLNNVQDAQCVSQLKSTTLSLQNALLDVALGSPPTTRRVLYTMPSCGGKSVEALRFAYYASPAYCRSCPGSFGGCWLVEPLVYDYTRNQLYRLADAITCVNMPSDIELSIDTDATRCLTERLTQNFCTRFVPGTGENVSNTVWPNCSSTFAGTLDQFNYATLPNREADGSIKARAMTFVKRQGEKVFSFQLTKQTGGGFASTVTVCPLRQA